ncbi:MAG: hypothetical protein KA369_01615 [Spirochaetes bacterium]|nr:hypothetical protein [Spirochaetota bacterium]
MKYIVSSLIIVLFIAATGCAAKKGVTTAAKRDAARPEAGDDESRDQCLRAIKRARVDARGGSYRMYLFGEERYDGEFGRFLGDYMKTRHGIELVISGSADRRRSKCYSNEMDKIIFNTFGPGVLAEAEREARDIFNTRK